MSTQPHSVLIVEDHPYTALRLQKSVASHPELSVGPIASTVEAGLTLIATHEPRIVLIDLGLPDGSGLEIIEAVSDVSWTCDSIVISVFGDEERVLAAIRKGARGYILKNDTEQEIGAHILSVIDGGSPISPKIARNLLTILGTRNELHTPQGNADLTQRETEILNLVAKGFKRHEIADALSISTGTVGNHINNIYKKLEVNSSIEALGRAKTLGIL